MLIIPRLEKVNIIAPPLTSKEIRISLLGTVKEIGYMGNELMEEIDDSSNFVFTSILRCNCIFANSLCLCDGGKDSNSCQPEICYVGTDGGGHPCANYDRIKEENKLNLFRFKELIYYQNRAVGSNFLKTNIANGAGAALGNAVVNFNSVSLGGGLSGLAGLGGEARSLQKEIDEVLQTRINYYQAIIAIQTDQRIINGLIEGLNKIIKEKELKEDLRDELIKFAITVDFLKKPIDNLASLPEQCAPNTQSQCNPRCLGECHDTYIGCQSICIGLNPCPFLEIGFAYGQIELVKGEIVSSTEEIMKIVDEIRKLKGETI